MRITIRFFVTGYDYQPTDYTYTTEEEFMKYIENHCIENNFVFISLVGIGGTKYTSPLELREGSLVYIKATPKLTVMELYNKLRCDKHIKRISNKKKPMATLPSGDQSWFDVNYESYTDEEKHEFKRLLSKRFSCNIDMSCSGLPYNGYVFYNVENFNKLCQIFEYTLQQGIDITSVNSKKPPKEMLFIRIAFGDFFNLSPLPESYKDIPPNLREYFNKFLNEIGEDPSRYRQKYLKYKNKYLLLQNI